MKTGLTEIKKTRSLETGIKSSQDLPDIKTSLTSDILETRFNMAKKAGRDMKEVMSKCNDIFKDSQILQYYIDSMKSVYKLERKNWKTGEVTYIRGLSIYVIKDLANLYSHLAYGVDYCIQHTNKVRAKAYCIDILSNTSQERFFETYLPERIIKLILQKKTNAPDEVYKYVYQDGIRRMRVCIEHILPLWLVEKVLILLLNKKLEFYKNKENRDKKFKEIFEGFKKIKTEIKTIKDLSDFLGFEITDKKLEDPKFFTDLEELYIGYRDEKVTPQENKSEDKKTRSTKDLENSKEDYERVTTNLKFEK